MLNVNSLIYYIILLFSITFYMKSIAREKKIVILIVLYLYEYNVFEEFDFMIFIFIK